MGRIYFTVLLLFAGFLSGCGAKEPVVQDAPEPQAWTEAGRLSYALGWQMGGFFRKDNLELDMAALQMGLADGFTSSPLQLNEAEMEAAILSLTDQVEQQRLAVEKEKARQNLAESTVFLEANKKKAGVHVLDSGLQYRILEEGSGPVPKTSDTVKVHYEGRYFRGGVFDSSHEFGEPLEFPVYTVISGWMEALTRMPVGSKWELFIPPHLAYGEERMPGIPPNTALIYEVELLGIVEEGAEKGN